MGNCSLMGSRSLMAISRPLFAPWASSAECLIVPNGPPVFVFTSKVPAECHLQHPTIMYKLLYSKIIMYLFYFRWVSIYGIYFWWLHFLSSKTLLVELSGNHVSQILIYKMNICKVKNYIESSHKIYIIQQQYLLHTNCFI